MRVGAALERLALYQALLSGRIILLCSFLLHVFCQLNQVEITVDIGQVLNDLRRINHYLYILLTSFVTLMLLLLIKGTTNHLVLLSRTFACDRPDMVSETLRQVFIVVIIVDLVVICLANTIL